MEAISYEAFDALFTSFQREALHLEMRDAYGTAAEIPHLRRWEAGEPDDTGWLQPWFDLVRAGRQAGKVFRRARVVSEPVSDCQRWVLKDTHLYVEAGEDIRWVPRSRVSTVALPGNDFWLFDDELVVFLIFAGSGLVADRQNTTDRSVIELCRAAFEAVWELSIPNSEYRPNQPGQASRGALGVRLREIRQDASLTGRQLAADIGCHFTKVSRIENGNQAPSEENIKAWCRVCHAEDQLLDLIATARAIESMYIEWRRQTRTGMKGLMLSSVPLYEQTQLFRIYEHNIIPGLFQTAEYSAAILSYFIDFLEAPDDLDAAVEARMERQRIIYSGQRRFAVVLEEQAIRARVGSADTMAGQLDRLLAIMSLPRLSLAIIPATAPRKLFASVGFWIYDDAMVGVETPTASLEISQPREIRLYAKMFDQLRQSAVHGAKARALVTRAMAELADH